MGSGSGGGGGGGSGGATSSGGVGYGGYRTSGGNIVVQDVDATEKADAVRAVLKKLRPEYLHEQFIDSAAGEVYRELGRIGVELMQNRDWSGIATRYGVDGGPGCLTRLASALMRRSGADLKTRSRAFVRMAIEDFLLRAVREESRRLVSGTAEQVIQHLDAGVFSRRSNLFLGELLYQVVRGEERALPPKVKKGLRGVVQQRADRIISDFESRFGGKPLGQITQVSYRHLFDVIALKEDWFLDQLRR
jgi:hypothetical protein